MKLKKFTYKSTPKTRAQARNFLAYAEGTTKRPKGFTSRQVLGRRIVKSKARP